MARFTRAVLAVVAFLALAASGRAQQEHASKLFGTWVRRADDCKVKLEVKPDGLRCTVTTEDGYAIMVEADYVTSKDGILVGILHAPKEVDKEEKSAVNKRLFCCQFEADGKALVIKDLDYDGNGDKKLREVIEGRYHKAEGAHKGQANGSTRPSKTKTSQAPTAPTNRYAEDPTRRIEELLRQSEDLRDIEYEWERIWYTDQPSHMTPERVHGPVQEESRLDWRRLWQFFAVDVPTTGTGYWVGW